MPGVGCQLGGALEEGRCGGVPAPLLGTAGGVLELGRDVLVRARRRSSAMPGAAVGVSVLIGGVSQGLMDVLALAGRRRPVGGGSHKRMGELDPAVDGQQPGVERRHGRGYVDADALLHVAAATGRRAARQRR